MLFNTPKLPAITHSIKKYLINLMMHCHQTFDLECFIIHLVIQPTEDGDPGDPSCFLHTFLSIQTEAPVNKLETLKYRFP